MMPKSIHRTLLLACFTILWGCESSDELPSMSMTLMAGSSTPSDSNGDQDDCTNDGLGCNAPFECLPRDDGRYACRRPPTEDMSPSSETGDMMPSGPSTVGGRMDAASNETGGLPAPGGDMGRGGDNEQSQSAGLSALGGREATPTGGQEQSSTAGHTEVETAGAGRHTDNQIDLDGGESGQPQSGTQTDGPIGGQVPPMGGSNNPDSSTPIERCDDVDHDGDGNPHNGFALGAACDGDDQDRCALGRIACDADGSGTVCIEDIHRTETCDGEDNDCDGLEDEGFQLGIPCDGHDADECAQGRRICNASGDGTRCEEDGSPVMEVCDGQDNDCDLRADEGLGITTPDPNGAGTVFLAKGTPCDGPDEDACTNGVVGCLPDGGVACVEVGGSIPERCDAQDNDCDGREDEGFALNEACDGDDADSCTLGMTVCAADGTDIVCNESGRNREEICDGIDNDCDETTDEIVIRGCNTCEFIENNAERNACLNMPLVSGQTLCETQDEVTQLVCDPHPPYDLSCNGEDDNGDGYVDNIEPTECVVPEALGQCAIGRSVCPIGCIRGHCEVPPGASVICRSDNRPECEIRNNDRDEDCDGRIDEASTPGCEPPDFQLNPKPTTGWSHPGTKKVAIAIDDDGLVHIAGYSTRRCDTYPCVYHATIDAQDNALFEVVTTRVDDGRLDDENADGHWVNDLWHTDIVIHNNTPVTCYRQWSSSSPPPYNVAIARRTQTADFIVGWDETVVSDRNAYACALGILDGKLVMAYGDGTPGQMDQRLMFATEVSPGQWVREVADDAPQVDLDDGNTLWPGQPGHQTDLVIHNGVPYIAHRDQANHVLRITAKINGQWKTIASPSFNDGRLAGLRPKMAATDDGLVILHGRAPFFMRVLDNPDQADLGLYITRAPFDLSESTITDFRSGAFGGAQGITAYEGGYTALFRSRDNTQFGRNTADSSLYLATYLGPIWFRETDALQGEALLYRSIDGTIDPFGLPIFAYAQTNLAAAHSPPRNEAVYLMRPEDRDGDRLPDVLETDGCFDPLNPDVDNDGRKDGLEVLRDTDPCMAD